MSTMNSFQVLVRREVAYNPETGEFTRLIRRSNRNTKDGKVESNNRKGRKEVMVLGVNYLAHRLAFFWMLGSCPKEIDHINGNQADNRWVNLRPSTRITNAQNLQEAHVDNASGFLGVSLASGKRKSKPWRADIRINGKNMCLGYFPAPEAAQAAYLLVKRTIHEGCTI